MALADAYDNLIRTTSDKKGMEPHEACEVIMGMAGTRFSLELVQKFLHSISIYPVGSFVKLSTGETGVVISQNKGLPTRPTISVLDFKEDQTVVQREVNFAREHTIFVDKIL